MAPLRWDTREPPGTASGNDGTRDGREAVSRAHRREGFSLTPKKRLPHPHQGAIRPGNKRLLPEPHRLVVEHPEPLVPLWLNGANRVHRVSFPSPLSPRDSR
jgi:hypothetical protein